MDSSVVLALAGVSVLILAVRGDLKNAWTALLGGDPNSAQITPAGSTFCYFTSSGTGTCTESAAQCTAFGGETRPDTSGYCAAGGAGRTGSAATGPGPGAPGSGVTTQ